MPSAALPDRGISLRGMFAKNVGSLLQLMLGAPLPG